MLSTFIKLPLILSLRSYCLFLVAVLHRFYCNVYCVIVEFDSMASLPKVDHFNCLSSKIIIVATVAILETLNGYSQHKIMWRNA